MDRDIYGAKEVNGLDNPQEYHRQERNTIVDWNDPSLAKITRLRLVSDPGFPVWDVSYCHGELKDGTLCVVQVPFSQLYKGKVNEDIILWAKKEKVYAKGLGIFDAISTLI